jgi:hypothetical protein
MECCSVHKLLPSLTERQHTSRSLYQRPHRPLLSPDHLPQPPWSGVSELRPSPQFFWIRSQRHFPFPSSAINPSAVVPPPRTLRNQPPSFPSLLCRPSLLHPTPTGLRKFSRCFPQSFPSRRTGCVFSFTSSTSGAFPEWSLTTATARNPRRPCSTSASAFVANVRCCCYSISRLASHEQTRGSSPIAVVQRRPSGSNMARATHGEMEPSSSCRANGNPALHTSRVRLRWKFVMVQSPLPPEQVHPPGMELNPDTCGGLPPLYESWRRSHYMAQASACHSVKSKKKRIMNCHAACIVRAFVHSTSGIYSLIFPS